MKIIGITLILLLNSLAVFSQQKSDTIKVKKTNPIIFGELFIGFTKGEIGYISSGLELNYQVKRRLFTFRYGYYEKYKRKLFGVPLLLKERAVDEYAFLYGWRGVKKIGSLSLSVGASCNSSNRIGIPFEFNLKFFKNKKKPYRLLFGLLPVGKETAFGKSLGLKIYGNIEKSSYIGIAIAYGLGWHKKY